MLCLFLSSILKASNISIFDRILTQRDDDFDVTEEEDNFNELCHLMYCEGRASERYDDTLVTKMNDRKLNPRICLGVCVSAYNLGCSKVIDLSLSQF